jgi:anti-sigma factor RsiW
MNEEQQLKLQAFFDGELAEKEAREVANLIARDRDAAALVAELRNTRQALSGFERDVKLPETREFYWSKISREIERLEPRESEVARPILPWFALLRRAMVPIGTVAVLLIAGFVATKQLYGPAGETSLADAGSFTYHDYESGATLVWFSYPAENEFARTSPADTVQ